MMAFAEPDHEPEEYYTNGIQEIVVPENNAPESEEPGEIVVIDEDGNEIIVSTTGASAAGGFASVAPFDAPTFIPPTAPTALTVNEAGRREVTVTTAAALRTELQTAANRTPLRLTITGNLDIASADGTITVNHPDVIIQGSGAIRTAATPAAGFPALTVPEGTTLVLRARVSRATGTGTRNGFGIIVQNGGRLIMDAPESQVDTGAAPADANAAGGVTVAGSNAIFQMQAGRINDNSGPNGGGVLVRDGATFNMFGGRIHQNRATTTANHSGGGGVRVIEGSTFNMYGGTSYQHETGDIRRGLSEATLRTAVNGLFATSGAAAVQGTYAVVENNRIDPISGAADNPVAAQRNWNRALRGGVGVFVAGQGTEFNLFSGNVRNNWVGDRPQFYGIPAVGMYTNNVYGSGAGVRVSQQATFNMTGGRINNNHLTGGGNASWGVGGGGVAVRDVGTVFNMYSGSITFNSRPGWLPNYGDVGRHGTNIGTESNASGLGHGSGTGGGGIYLSNGAVVNLMGDADVSFNAARRGGGIAMEGCTMGSPFPTEHGVDGLFGGGSINGVVDWNNVTTVLNISQSATINNNRAIEGWMNASGGGIFVGPHSEVRMFGGYLEDNEVTNCVEGWMANGGGARVTARGHFIMMGGYVRNNRALHTTYGGVPDGGLQTSATRLRRIPRRSVGGGLAARSDRGSGVNAPAVRPDGSRLNDARITIFAGTLYGNEAGRGGGIGMNANSTVIIHGGTIKYNYAVGFPAYGTDHTNAGNAGGGIATFESELDTINTALQRLTVRPNATIRDNRVVGLFRPGGSGTITGPITSQGNGLLQNAIAGERLSTWIHGNRAMSIPSLDQHPSRNLSLPVGFPHPSMTQLRAAGHHLIINDNFYRDHGDYHHLPMNPPPADRNPWRISPGVVTEGHVHPFNNFDIGTARNVVLYPALGIQPYFEGRRYDPITDETDFYQAHWGVVQVSTPVESQTIRRYAHAPRYDATLQYWRSSPFIDPPFNVMIGRPMADIVARNFANSTVLGVDYSTANPLLLNVREEQGRYIEVHFLDTVRTPVTMTLVTTEEEVRQGGSIDLTARIQSQFYAMTDYVYERYEFPLRFWDVVTNNYIYPGGTDFVYRRVVDGEGEYVREYVKDRVETLPITVTYRPEEGEDVTAFHYERGDDQSEDCELDLDFHNHDAPITVTDTELAGRERTRTVPVIFPPQSIVEWTVTREDGTPEPGVTVTVDEDGNITLNVSRDAEPGEITVTGRVDGTNVTGELEITIVELGARITFHAYGKYSFQTPNGPVDYIEVPVTFGEAPDFSAVEAYLDYVDYRGALAFWGWFTDDGLATGIGRSDLDAYGRRNGFRRPAVGTSGFEHITVIIPGTGAEVLSEKFATITEDEFDDLADEDGNIDLFAIWSLWGDVDDNDVVDLVDANLLFQHARGAYPQPVINLAAGDVHRDGIVDLVDANVVFQYARGASPRPILGLRSTPPTP